MEVGRPSLDERLALHRSVALFDENFDLAFSLGELMFALLSQSGAFLKELDRFLKGHIAALHLRNNSLKLLERFLKVLQRPLPQFFFALVEG